MVSSIAAVERVAAEVIEESSEVVDGLRATVHSLRKELRRAERDHSVQSRRIDELEAVRDRWLAQRGGASAGVASRGASRPYETPNGQRSVWAEHARISWFGFCC